MFIKLTATLVDVSIVGVGSALSALEYPTRLNETATCVRLPSKGASIPQSTYTLLYPIILGVRYLGT